MDGPQWTVQKTLSERYAKVDGPVSKWLKADSISIHTDRSFLVEWTSILIHDGLGMTVHFA